MSWLVIVLNVKTCQSDRKPNQTRDNSNKYCESWSLTLSEEQRLRVFVNKVLRRIFGAKRDKIIGEWRKLQNAELYALYSSPDIIRNLKLR